MPPNPRSQSNVQPDVKPEYPGATPEAQPTDGPQPSTLPGFRKFPQFNNLSPVDKSSDNWLTSKQDNDEVGSIWRVHDKLYDLSTFISSHPGGPLWLEKSRGMDITELFESSHFGELASRMLETYYVRDAITPRYSPFTFHQNGFYKTLRRKALPIIQEHGTAPEGWINRIQDILVTLTIFCGILAAGFDSYVMIVISSLALCFLTNLSHNYIHQKDSFRMFWFNLSFLSHEEWRVTHVMSHHVYPNTTYDWEMVALEPFLNFFSKLKPWYQKYMSLITFHFVNAFLFYFEFIRRVTMLIRGKQSLRWFNLIPFVTMLIPMIAVSDNAWHATVYFFIIHLIGSYAFALVGLTIGHHHPDNFHDGDTPRKDRDWGLNQLDSISDREEFDGKKILSSIFFADHSLHHLFPTVDHSKLPYLYPVFLETCKEFGHDFELISQWEAIKGCLQMLLKTSDEKDK